MLAAAIRASLIEAGEPDTNQPHPAQSSQRHDTQQHKPLDQHQDGVPSQSSPFALPLHQASAAEQHLLPPKQSHHQHHHHNQQQQQQQQKQQQEEEEQDRQKQQEQRQSSQWKSQQQQDQSQQQGQPTGFSAAASQFGDLASALQDSASSQGMSQSSALQRPSKGSGRGVTWLSPDSAESAQLPGHMRPSKSSHALLQMNGDADKMLSSSAEGGQLVEQSYSFCACCLLHCLLSTSDKESSLPSGVITGACVCRGSAESVHLTLFNAHN